MRFAYHFGTSNKIPCSLGRKSNSRGVLGCWPANNDLRFDTDLRTKRGFFQRIIEIDGHNIEQFVDATEEARAVYKKPSVIIANTIPGKGVDFMEKKFEWHGKPPNPKEARSALAQLRTLGGTIQSEHE